MLRAVARYIPQSFGDALSAVRPDPPIDVPLAQRQHAAYCMALARTGAEVTVMPADESCPDCVFVEDTALVIANTALITRPGAPTRQPETAPVASLLDAWCEIIHMTAPATLDGGDVMVLDKTIYVARSGRTNDEGIAWLERVFGRRHRIVRVDLPDGILHLKCVCSPLGPERMLLADASIQPRTFTAEIIRVPVEETYAANAVAIGNQVIVAEGFPRTHEALAAAGFELHPVPVSEVRKADGSLTCQSLVF
jgi:dimethylargininase